MTRSPLPPHALSILCVAALLAACGGGGGDGGGTPPPVVVAPPTAVAPTTGLFVNAAPDPAASDKAAAYVGWTATAGATGYQLNYTIDGGSATTLNVGATTGTLIQALSPGALLSVTVTTIGAGGVASTASAAVVATLPRPSTPTETAAYASAASYSDAQNGEAMVVFRNGAVVYTHYSAGYADTAHPLASGTKSFNCALEAFAEQDGLLKLGDKASTVIAEWATDPKKSLITLQDLLSLQSGLTGNPGYSPLTASMLDTYQQAVYDTATYAPGQAFVYDPLSFQAFALDFQVRSGGVYAGNGQVTGGNDPVTYLQTRLFGPLGIAASAYAWGRDAKGHPQMAGGASFSATDWLRYGQFMLQRGTWQSTRLLPAAALDYCTGGYVNPAYGGYGISWWLNAHSAGTYDPTIDRLPPDGAPQPGSDQVAPSAPVDTYMAAGTGNERLYVIPSLGLVIVRFSPLTSTVTSSWSDNTFLGKAIGALP